jgi:hypothetical protein
MKICFLFAGVVFSWLQYCIILMLILNQSSDAEQCQFYGIGVESSLHTVSTRNLGRMADK